MELVQVAGGDTIEVDAMCAATSLTFWAMCDTIKVGRSDGTVTAGVSKGCECKLKRALGCLRLMDGDTCWWVVDDADLSGTMGSWGSRDITGMMSRKGRTGTTEVAPHTDSLCILHRTSHL